VLLKILGEGCATIIIGLVIVLILIAVAVGFIWPLKASAALPARFDLRVEARIGVIDMTCVAFGSQIFCKEKDQ
jgi:hypothetical protein